MFYCPLHNWYSSQEPCKACFQLEMVTTTVATAGVIEMPENKRVYSEEDMRRCFNAAKPIMDHEVPTVIMKKSFDMFEDYLKIIQKDL